MEALKNILRNQEKIYCIGMRGMERYDFFRGLLPEGLRKLVPESDLQSKLNYHIVIYPHNSGQGFYEDCSGNMFSLQQYSFDTDLRAVYLPVSHRDMKNKCVYIIPPALDYKGFVEGSEKIFAFDGTNWLKRDDKVLWFDSFPYAQIDELNLAREIRNDKTISGRGIEFIVCMVKGSRRFGYSDIEDEDTALDDAIKIYSRWGFEGSLYTVDYRSTLNEVIDKFYYKAGYMQRIGSMVEKDIRLQYGNFYRYYEEDFQFAVSERLTVKELDDICSYRNWKSWNQDTLFDCWLHYMKEEAKAWKDDLLEFIFLTYLKYIAVGEVRSEVEEFIRKEWKLLEKKLLKNWPMEKLVDRSMDEIEYLSYVKEYKLLFKKTIYDFVNISLKRDIKKFIEDAFAVWGQVIDLQDAELEAAVAVDLL